jgi:signal transduction histidine kinase
VVWLRGGTTLEATGMWCADGDRGLPPDTSGLVRDDHTDFAVVRHENEDYGALSISKPGNDPVNPADRELLADVADGAGLLLHNMHLNRELQRRADQVRESRQRLIAAQDAERHRLERNLHDGAQQQVVALKVKLGIAKTIAQREGAPEIAGRIAALADETQGAVDALRAVAHGIYPPLLESDGLGPALRAMERSSPIPVTIDLAALSRYPRAVEETVYFCVLATLERARMSGATDAGVGVTTHNGNLVTEVDLGSIRTEPDLQAISDRLDAAGGTLSIDIRPDSRRRVTASLPAPLHVVEAS